MLEIVSQVFKSSYRNFTETCTNAKKMLQTCPFSHNFLTRHLTRKGPQSQSPAFWRHMTTNIELVTTLEHHKHPHHAFILWVVTDTGWCNFSDGSKVTSTTFWAELVGKPDRGVFRTKGRRFAAGISGIAASLRFKRISCTWLHPSCFPRSGSTLYNL